MREGSISFDDRVWRCLIAGTLRERTRGLLGRPALPPETLLLLPRCNAVHTIGMRLVIDLIFLDRGGRVVNVVRAVPPNRMVWGGWRARQTLETASGWLPAIPPGTRLTITSTPTP